MLAYVALGSNMGDRQAHIEKAAAQLNGLNACKLVQISAIYETEPMGPQNQPDYLNAVCSLECQLKPDTLLKELKLIEQLHGRAEVAPRWTARPLDLDIVLYGQRTIISRHLCVPHIGVSQRSFVLWPLAELDPTLTIPGFGPISSLLEFCQPFGIERYSNERR